MIHSPLHQQLMYWISAVVYVQLALVMALAGLTIMLLSFRKWRSVRLQALNQKNADLLVEELISLMDKTPTVFLRPPGRFEWLQRQSLKETMLEQIQSVSGNEKQHLIDRYFDLGFASADYALCYSWFWGRRIEGVSNLSLLNSERLVDLFNQMKEDPIEIVAAAALLALSEFNHPSNTLNVPALLPLVRKGRQSTIVQIVTNWCGLHGFDPIFKSAIAQPDHELRDAVILSALTAKTPDSAGDLQRLLDEQNDFSPILLAEVIRSLKEISDPASGESVERFMHHSDELVRQRVLEFMIHVGTDDLDTKILAFKEDLSPGVKRLVRQWKVERPAA